MSTTRNGAWRIVNWWRPRGLLDRLFMLTLAVFGVGVDLDAGFLEEPSQRVAGIAVFVGCCLWGVLALGPRRVSVRASRHQVNDRAGALPTVAPTGDDSVHQTSRYLRVDKPLQLAAEAHSIDAAAKAAAAIEAEVSLASDRAEGWYEEASDALEELHRRFPGFHRRDAYAAGPTLSHSARRELAGAEQKSQLLAPMPTLATRRWSRPYVLGRALGSVAVLLLVVAVFAVVH